MSDDTDPDANEIDALLREDAIRNNIADGGPGAGCDPRTDHSSSQPTQQTQIQRLLARSAHISSNLRLAVMSIRDTGDMVELDRESCARLSAELDNWEQLLVELDQACRKRFGMPADDSSETGAAQQRPGAPAEDPHPLLMAKIAAQDAKIRELESQLRQNDAAGNNDPSPSSAAKSPQDDDANQTVNRLIIAMTDQGNLKFPLRKRIITIGRSPQNDIHIRSRFISRFHARIVCDQNEAIIEDLDSSNGVSVNSNRARRQSLRSGDLIDLGRTQLRYIDLSEGSSEGQA